MVLERDYHLAADELRLLAAIDVGEASKLLWAMLSGVRDRHEIAGILAMVERSGVNPWALAVMGEEGLDARLSVLGVETAITRAMRQMVTEFGLLENLDLALLDPLVIPPVVGRKIVSDQPVVATSVHLHEANGVNLRGLVEVKNLDLQRSRNLEFPALERTVEGGIYAKEVKGLNCPSLQSIGGNLVLEGVEIALFDSLFEIEGAMILRGSTGVSTPRLKMVGGRRWNGPQR